MDLNTIKKLAPAAALAYLGVRASELLGASGFVGAAAGVGGALLGLLIAEKVAK